MKRVPLRFISRSRIVWPLTLGVLVVLCLGLFRAGGWRGVPGAPRIANPERLARLPHVILWAWERPERLSFIDSHQVGVAFLARTLYLRGDRVVVRPRLQPLELPDHPALIAVVRIEPDRAQSPTLSTSQLQAAAERIVDLAHAPDVAGVQID